MIRLRLADFAGEWQIDRQIIDMMGQSEGTFQGTAAISASDDGMYYLEQGVLRMGNSALSATRSYVWRDAEHGISVFFDDGRPFHDIRLVGETAAAAHFCDPDQYDVSYDFSDWPVWTANWRVRGPRKDYVMRSIYRRPAVGL